MFSFLVSQYTQRISIFNNDNCKVVFKIFCYISLACIFAEKRLGNWTNKGNCNAIGEDKTCGPGTQHQSRDCIDGSLEKCEDSEKDQVTSCNLKDCPKTRGSWTDSDECKADGTDPTCGPGRQNQTRVCTDGTTDRCTESDTNKIVSCALRDCPKILGRWRYVAQCDTDTQEKSCGPGSRFQKRDCDDGTTDRCTRWDKEQYTGCSLVDCPKKLGNWTTSGNCVGTGRVELSSS